MSERTSSTADRLVDAATVLLDRGGPDAVTLREVGRLSGVSHNAPYKHFADKDALLASIAARELRDLTRRIERATRRTVDHRKEMAACAHTYLRWALDHPMRFKLTFGRWTVDDAGLGSAAEAARAAFQAPFQRAFDDGAIDVPPARAAQLVWATVHGVVDLQLTGHLFKEARGTRPEQVLDEVVNLLLATTSPPPET